MNLLLKSDDKIKRRKRLDGIFCVAYDTFDTSLFKVFEVHVSFFIGRDSILWALKGRNGNLFRVTSYH